MGRRRGVVLIGVLALLTVASCGDATQQQDAGFVPPPPSSSMMSDSDPAANVDVSIAPPIDPATTAPTEYEATTEYGAYEAYETELTATTSLANVEPATTLPLGGVTIDDPLPAQADAVADPSVAEAAVRYAFQHWILVDLDPAIRGRIVENGEQNAAVMDANFEAARSQIDAARIAVDSVSFVDAEHGDVVFHVMYGERRSPIFPDDMTGQALFQNGSWRITSRSLCVLALGIGRGCGGQSSENPVSPAALQLTVVPAGYEQVGPAPAPDVITVGGFAEWRDPITSEQFSVTTEALAGVSALSTEDAAFVLAKRYPIGEEAFDDLVVDGRPGRGFQSGPTATIAYVRADDVIVSMSGSMTMDQFIVLAASLQPVTDPADSTSVG